MIFGILSMVAFNLVDTYFIGLLGTEPLAAISFTFPVIFIIAGVSMGLGVGASAAVSRAIGKGDHHEVERLTTDSLILSLLIVAVFILAGILTVDPIFRLLNATDALLPLIRQYMMIWYPGMLFLVVPMMGNNVIRATGDTRTPSLIMLFAVGINAILDPLLIFGIGPFPRMELQGAALATVIARAVTMGLSLYVLIHREKMICFNRPSIEQLFKSWRDVLYVGIPVSGTNIIIPIGSGVITRIVASHGTEAVAAFGVGSRVEAFALTVIMALATVLGPFIGQNLGAGKCDRIRRGIFLSTRFAILWGLFMTLLLAVSARWAAALFSDDPKVRSFIALYMWIIPISYGLQSVIMLVNSALNVMKKPIHASLLMIIHMFVLYIPFAYLGSKWMGVSGVFGAGSIVRILTGLGAILLIKIVMDRQQSRIESQNCL
ncbi:MATE family efflux transporter [candidate division KSB1 bacterium]|nr:MATE family efflux transporter [candidate division KSB1 bacterium]